MSCFTTVLLAIGRAERVGLLWAPAGPLLCVLLCVVAKHALPHGNPSLLWRHAWCNASCTACCSVLEPVGGWSIVQCLVSAWQLAMCIFPPLLFCLVAFSHTCWQQLVVTVRLILGVKPCPQPARYYQSVLQGGHVEGLHLMKSRTLYASYPLENAGASPPVASVLLQTHAASNGADVRLCSTTATLRQRVAPTAAECCARGTCMWLMLGT